MTAQNQPLWWRRLMALEPHPAVHQEHGDSPQAWPDEPPARWQERDDAVDPRLAHDQVLAWLSQERMREARTPTQRVR